MKRKNRSLIIAVTFLVLANIAVLCTIFYLHYNSIEKTNKYFTQANNLYAAGDYEGSLAALNQIASSKPNDPDILLLKAKLLTLSDSPELATVLETFEKLELTAKQKAKYANDLAAIKLTGLLKAADYNEAVTLFNEYNVLPLDPQLAIQLIKHTQELGQPESGLKLFKLLSSKFDFDDDLKKAQLKLALASKNVEVVSELFAADKALFLADNDLMLNIEELLITEQSDTLLSEIYHNYMDEKRIDNANYARLAKFFKARNDNEALQRLQALAKELQISFSDPEAIGNTQGNILNHGIVANTGNKIFFPAYSSGYLSLTEDDFATKTVILESKVDYLNATPDHVYFIDGDNFAIKRVDLAGKNLQVIFEGKSTQLLVYKGYLYFIDINDGKKVKRISLHSIDLGEAEVETLVADSASEYAISEQMLVYHAEGERKMHLLNLESKEDKVLLSAKVSHINIAQDRIYYLNLDKSSQIEMLNINGGEPSVIYKDKQCNQLNVIPGSSQTKDVLLFEKINLTRMRGDGNDFYELGSDLISRINAIGSNIYFYIEDANDNGLWSMFKQNISGGDMTKVVGK